MDESKFLKAKCKKTGLYFGLDVKKYGSSWKVVNMIRLSDEEAALTTSEVRQSSFETNTNLIPCSRCGSRVVGGCSCAKKLLQCSSNMKYKFDCVYCKELQIDYSMPTAADISRYGGGTVTLSQGKEIKVVTFSNVKWEKFDKVIFHESGAGFREPKIHIVANKENIEFHGYNVSRMDEGVYYKINENDDFEIDCNVDTSKIKPHPGGHLYISFGDIEAHIDQSGGSFTLGGQKVATVRSRFHMVLSLMNGEYSIIINDEIKGSALERKKSKKKIIFGFTHESHCCELLSHAYIKGIKMKHGVSSDTQK